MGLALMSTRMRHTSEEFTADVRQLAADRLEKISCELSSDLVLTQLLPNKMLRTRLAGRLAECGGVQSEEPDDMRELTCLCGATELVHAASLCHDDVVDNAHLRRRQPALWRQTSASGAILIGDLLLCEAIDILSETQVVCRLGEFVAKVREVIAAETEQELVLRGQRLDADTCIRVARGKTGPLFALTAAACATRDTDLHGALEEAGYLIGTAYQLWDDLLDVVGPEHEVGKTLGTDSGREKFTIAQGGEEATNVTRDYVRDLCNSALECVSDYPNAHQGIMMFIVHDLKPVMSRYGEQLDPCMEYTFVPLPADQ